MAPPPGCTRYKRREPVSITIVPAGSFVGFCKIAAVFRL
jgi:hypothetical protein